MNKVSVQLQGGLGNYLFQIASAYSYAFMNNKQPIFPNISHTVHRHISTYSNTILSNVKFSADNDRYIIYQEPGFHFNAIPVIDGNVQLIGYFQSEKYFKDCKNEIQKLFSYPDDYVLEIKEKYADLLNKVTCSIHVRRGDYVTSPDHHPTQNLDYYKHAINALELPDVKFIVFSDDIKWCKEQFSTLENDFVYIENTPDYEDLLLMSLCNHNIICNSTFSWWGAWLNKNIEKKVIVPSKWFGVAYNYHKTDDLYCEDWIKI